LKINKSMSQTQNLNLSTVNLYNKNLIEASAGTGKTYSIAVLIVRMILERQDLESIKDILTVTFTNAAVQELRDRIRLFIYKTYNYLNSSRIDDNALKAIIDQAIEKNGTEDTLHKVKKSLLLIDEASIFTIHGFIQRVLIEYPFETGQSFQAETTQDIHPLIDNTVMDFWRKHIIHLPVPILDTLDTSQLKSLLTESIQHVINHKRYSIPEHLKNFSINDYIEKHLNAAVLDELHNLYLILKDLWENQRNTVIQELSLLNISGKPQNKFSTWDKSIDKFLLDFEKKINTNYVANARGFFFDDVHKYLELKDRIHEHIDALQLIIIQQFLREYHQVLTAKIKDNNIVTFDSLILTLKDRLTDIQDDDTLLVALREKYKVVFIDEFQDTDYNQFVIFNTIFLHHPASTVFLIGDPKQSIYSFRGADIDCYLYAKQQVDNIYNMNINYRSSAEMVNAINEFYALQPSRTIFGYKDDDELYIEYEPVHAKKPVALYQNGQLVSQALTLMSYNNKNDAIDNLINTVTQLLSSEYQYTLYNKDTQTHQAIKPEDIGILVRGRSEGSLIKHELSKLGIPCIQLFEGKIFETEETLQIIYLLQSFLEPHLNNITKAIYFSFLKYIPDYKIGMDEVSINERIITPYYSTYSELVEQNKTYEALYAFLEDFGVREYFSQHDRYTPILSHIEQILQAINTFQYTKKASTAEVIQWLYDHYYQLVNNDEYTLSLESDESAVKIITIHRSKGLEYPITLIQGNDKEADIKGDIIQYKHAQSFDTYFSLIHSVSDEVIDNIQEKLEQENRRLLYVSLTRAVYKTFYFFSTYYNSALKLLAERLDNTETQFAAHYINEKVERADLNLERQKKQLNTCSLNRQALYQLSSQQVALSYSALSKHHDYMPTPILIKENESAQDYNEVDDFLFKKLPKGAYLGTIMHEIFQHLPLHTFIDSEITLQNKKWLYIDAVKNLKYFLDENFDEEIVYKSLYNIYHAQLIDHHHQKTFTLSELDQNRTLHELEFNFHLHIESASEVINILQEYDAFADFSEEKILGLMNGFIDMIFEKDGKYYILDWKTNHIGHSLDEYQQTQLYDAMTAHNYHLQYIIYTLALHIYLQERLVDYEYERDFGGVFYLFIRGCRAEQNSGVFYARPSSHIIEALQEHLYNFTQP